MGIKSIMQARQILVVVSGEDKADIVKKAFFGPVEPQMCIRDRSKVYRFSSLMGNGSFLT